MPEQYESPPPGTPCCVCHAAGHFCQADDWTAGEKRNGICFPCLEQRDCDISAEKRKAAVYKGPEISVVWSTPPPVRSKREQTKVQAEKPAATKKPSGPYKRSQREIAASMLRDGYPMYQIIERTNLSKNTILDVKRELGMLMSEQKEPPQEEKPIAEPLRVERQKVEFSSGKSVTLKSGGVITVSGSFNIFGLNSQDRKFVGELIDKLESYQ